MDTMPASQKQRELFQDLSQLPYLVLAIKSGELCSVNAHGRFQLYDKEWSADKKETLIAFCRTNEPSDLSQPAGPLASPEMTTTMEPLVHWHVDWRSIRYVRVADRIMPLIQTQKEIVLSSTKVDRVIWFYAKNSLFLHKFAAKWGTPTELAPPLTS